MAEPIDEIRSRVEALETEITTLAAKDEITPDEDARLDAALNEIDDARTQLANAETRAARLAEFRTPVEPVITERTVIAPVNVNKRTNPFDLDELRTATPEKRATEVRARAVDIIESGRGAYEVADYAAEDLTKKLSRRGQVANDIAELVVQTGSDEYREAFENLIANPGSVTARMEMERRQSELYSRAAVQMSNVAGAIAIPFQLDPTIILTNAGVVDPVRSVARNVTISGTDKWVPVTSAGVTAGYVGESTAFSDNTPTVTSNTIQVWKAGAFALSSWEADQDSGFSDEFGMMFAEAKARFEGGQFATGTGSSAIQGIVTYASNATSVVTGSSTGGANSANLAPADIYALRAALSPRWRGNASWMGSLDVTYQIRQLGNTNNYHAFTLDLTQSDTLSLLGKPYYENSSMDTTIVSGSTDFVLLHGDFSQYAVVDRVGMVLQYIPTITSGSKFPTGESGWAAWWRVGGGGIVQDAFRLLKL